MLEKPKGKRVSRYKKSEEESQSKLVPLEALNNNQKAYLAALKKSSQVIVLGPSGTGKTYIAATYAANLYLMKRINKIIITRPAVSVGKSLGALPGTMEEKFGPWLSPVLSVLEEQLGKGVVETGIKNGNIVMAPLEYMRGSSFKDAFILADECFLGDTEVLTEGGFVRLDELKPNVKVAQYVDGRSEFVVPSRIVDKEYKGDLVSISNQRFSMTATSGHTAVFKGANGELVQQEFKEHVKTNYKIPVAGEKVDWEGEVPPEVILSCALQADGSYLGTKTTAGNYTNYWSCSFSRDEKIQRLEQALVALDLPYTISAEDKKGRVRFYIPKVDTRYFTEDLKPKTFNSQAIIEANLHSAFLKECLFWDGSTKGRANVYCSTNKENIDTIQMFAHMCGYMANFGVQYDKRPIFKVKPKPYYRLNISKQDTVGVQRAKKEVTNYEGRVYCVTVPSGMIYVRQNGKVFITGNCQNLDVAQFKMLVTRIGENCQLVLNGDVRQSDIKEQSGLSKAIHLASKHNIDASVVEFQVEDIVRSEICKQWVEAFYEEGI